VALLPFFLWRNRILLAGAGPTDYCDGLFAHSRCHADEVLAMLADYADELGCERIELQQLAAGSPLLTAALPGQWTSEVAEGTVCPVTTLGGEDALAAVSPRWRKNVAKARSKLRRVAAFTLDCASTSLFGGAAAELTRLHAARWEQRNRGGVFANPYMSRFLNGALPELSQTGLLRLHTLRVDSQPIAILFALHHGAMTCYYIGGFDPRWATYSPGNIILEAAMLQAARDGAAEFHFLRGSESYKYHFGAKDRPTFNRVLAPASLARRAWRRVASHRIFASRY
jgi:CelD/BcsL family acetyltransferase involved in cellulose biosynthesis